MSDKLWTFALWMPVFLGSIANSYGKYGSYFVDELPDNRECDDLPNKLKWIHIYKRRAA